MALKFFHLLFFVRLPYFPRFCSIGHAKRDMPHDKITSPFDFLNHLKGCHKGNKTKGINQLKYYLQEFGYLDHNNSHVNNDDFDDALEHALKMVSLRQPRRWSPIDGPGGTLAHAFAPTNGRFHYDADERWSVGPVADAFHLETIVVHEIGHLLGLGHSSVKEAIMYPSIRLGETKNLHADDLHGIRALYNV